MDNLTIILKRTFNQHMPMSIAAQLDPLHVARTAKHDHEASVRYWRVVGPPSHKNYGSDLSLQGLKEWRVIQ